MSLSTKNHQHCNDFDLPSQGSQQFHNNESDYTGAMGLIRKMLEKINLKNITTVDDIVNFIRYTGAGCLRAGDLNIELLCFYQF